jgi:hypothetical protein
MKPNIFAIYYSSLTGPEDTLTAFWQYVLTVVPGLGQAFVDELSRKAGLSATHFVGVLDHPRGSHENRPDLLLQCTDWQLLFEHKLDSQLGPDQLRRYLDLAVTRGWKLALMAGTRIEVDPHVLASAAYVRPTSKAGPAHFTWEDLQPVLRSVDHHLALEFAEFLEENGFGTVSWAGRGNPLFVETARAELLALYDSLRPLFKGAGVRCSKSANSLVYQVRTPFQPIHLLNIGLFQTVAQDMPEIRGPAVELWVWVRRSEDGATRVLRNSDEGRVDASLPISVRNHANPRALKFAAPVYCERSYYVPASEILRDSLVESRERMVNFVQSAVHHLESELRGKGSSIAASRGPSA